MQQIKKVNSGVGALSYTQYQSIMVFLSQNYKLIQFLKFDYPSSVIQKNSGNPLTNEGLVCAGGYSTEGGCFANNGQITSNEYGKVELRVEPLLEGCYAELPSSMTGPKLK